jgi:hypothetical protein
MRPRPSLILAALLLAPSLRAQSAADSALTRLDSALARYCATKRPTQYVCAETLDVAVVRLALTSAPVPPADSTDTTPPPVVITPGPPPGGTIFAHPLAPPSNGALLAELPRDTVSIAYPSIARRIRVTSLQSALDTARAGDELLLAPGSLHPLVTVRRSACWVVVRTDVPDDGDLWHRMTPARADSLNLATITTTSSTAAVTLASGSGCIRFALVRITGTYSSLTAVVRAANSETSVAALPHDLTLDRVVVDATTSDVGRCVYFDVVRGAVTSSTLLNCHSKGRDAQGILVINGAGPFRVENHSIEASHQAIMSGGGAPSIQGLVPSDWVIRRNWFGRPLRWKKTGPTYGPDEWQVKTIVESKSMRRVLLEDNVLANLWPDAQAGFAFLLKTSAQGSGATWMQTSDITVRYNRLVNVANGFNLASVQDGGTPMARVTIYGNVVAPFSYGGGIPIQHLGAIEDVVIQHNTFGSASNLAVSFDGAAGLRTVISGNVIPHGTYGVKGTGTAEGTATLAKFTTNGLFQTNVVYPAVCSVYPVGTVCALPSVLPSAWDGQPIGADAGKVPQ